MGRIKKPQLLTTVLKSVSRSFYLTLAVLPAPIRDQISLAYLLARTSDTIADSANCSEIDCLQLLDRFNNIIAGSETSSLDLSHLKVTDQSEAVLLKHIPDIIDFLSDVRGQDRKLIQRVLGIIISGQKFDLQRFSSASRNSIVALENDIELEDYTYRVAGSVGEFWTEICQLHLFKGDQNLHTDLIKNGILFGKGLQLVNILRDLPRDLNNGRCYLPQDALREHNLVPNDLLNPSNEPRLRPLFDSYVARAESYLRAGWEYTNRLPWSQVRVRLACAWPVLLGMATLGKLRGEGILDSSKRKKVSRTEVRRIMLGSIIHYPFPKTWYRLINTAAAIR